MICCFELRVGDAHTWSSNVLNYHQCALVDFLRLVMTKDFLQCDYIFQIIMYNKRNTLICVCPAIWESWIVVRWFLNTNCGFSCEGPGICEPWTTWWTDFKTLRRFFSRNLLESSFAIALFRSALFSLTCLFLHFLGSVILHRRIQLLRLSALLFRIFLHSRISEFPFYFQFVIDLIFFIHLL